MNTIYYANPATKKREAVRVGQGGVDWLEQTKQRKTSGRLPMNHSKRRRTMAEADDAMLKRGFIRWARNKPL